MNVGLPECDAVGIGRVIGRNLTEEDAVSISSCESEDGGSKLMRNVMCLANYTALHSERPYCSYIVP
jgi:hypothetical protein